MLGRVMQGLCLSAALSFVGTMTIGAAQAAEPVTLHWLEWWDAEWGVDVMDGLTKKFEDKTGIKVERTAVPWDSMYDLLVADAQGEGKFDVMGMEGCCFLSGIDKLGGIEPLGTLLEADKDFAARLTDLTPVKWDGRADDAQLVHHALLLRVQHRPVREGQARAAQELERRSRQQPRS